MSSSPPTAPVIRPDIKWTVVSEARYMDMLECLWPACNMGKPYGFLVGEPWDHARCTVTGNPGKPRFAPFLRLLGRPEELIKRHGLEGDQPMTKAEFFALTADDLAAIRLGATTVAPAPT